MSYPSTLLTLIDCYKKFPGIGEKSAERMALYTLTFDEEYIKQFSKSLIESKEKIKYCKICGNFTENEICDICADNSRDKKVICVVEDVKNINMIEKTNSFNGLYHILNGLISPINGVNPEDINIQSLINRVKSEKIKELILVLKPSIEGETTALYISRLFEKSKTKVSKIANGIPIGIDLDYIDTLTIEQAIRDRKMLNSE